MIEVSSKEFTTHPKKYFGMAMDSGVCIRRGRNTFRLTPEPIVADEQPILQPDEDLRKAITMEELRASAHEFIHKLYAGK